MGKWLFVFVLVGCGSATPVVPVENAAPCKAGESPGEAIAREALTAVAAGNAEAVAKLAPPRSVVDKLMRCDHDADRVEADEIARSFIDVTAKARGAKLEVIALRDAWQTARPRRYATDLEKLVTACAGKLDVTSHAVEAKIRTQAGDAQSRESIVRVDLMTFDGRMYVTSLPRIRAGSAATEALAMMRGFTDRMCQCADKACADRVQEDMTKWGTEAAKAADRDERPDPDMVKQAGEIMTRYTECMTKLMMMSAPSTP
jgi:hypothetical protein